MSVAIEEAKRILAHAARELAPQCFRDAAWPTLSIGGWRFFPGNNVLYSPLHVDTLHGRKYVRTVYARRALCLIVRALLTLLCSAIAYTSFVAFSDALYLRFRAAGLTAERLRRPFEPHMTLWKVSRDRVSVNRANKAMKDSALRIQDALLAHLTEHHAHASAVEFGTERLVTMELLVMQEKAPDGTSLCLRHGYHLHH